MTLRKSLARLGITVAAGYGVIFAIPHLASLGPRAPDDSDMARLREALAPPSHTQTTPPPPLPDGFPSVSVPPPEVPVEPGLPQPIATKFGLTYDVPPDWERRHGAIAGWDDIAYSSIARIGAGHCHDESASRLGLTGATGRNGIDLDSAARDEIRRAEQFFAAEDGRVSTIEYSDRIEMVVDGQPAVRYTAQVTNIPRQSTCDPPSAQFDVVATKGFSTAEVMVLIVQLDQGIPGSRGPSVADRIISSLRVS